MTNPWIILGILVVITAMVIVAYTVWPSKCPTEIRTLPDGQILIKPTGKSFENKEEFQKWWDHSEFKNRCPLPVSIGKGGRNVEKQEIQPEKEKTYATTPINKVDDYEFSRIFGTEVNGHMVLDKEDYNTILFDRTQDWVNKPYSSEERKQITEGFAVKDQVKDIVMKAYSSEPDYEPVITQIGENHWEVNELKPKRSEENATVTPTPAQGVDAHASFQYRSTQDIDAAIDPYFTGLSGHAGRYGPRTDPFGGPVPGMERMFGPTLDTTRWV